MPIQCPKQPHKTRPWDIQIQYNPYQNFSFFKTETGKMILTLIYKFKEPKHLKQPSKRITKLDDSHFQFQNLIQN